MRRTRRCICTARSAGSLSSARERRDSGAFRGDGSGELYDVDMMEGEVGHSSFTSASVGIKESGRMKREEKRDGWRWERS